jgi:hypothetical protein
VGIYLDTDDNTLKSVNGATTGDSPAITPDSPVFPESAVLSANVRLNGDQTTFSEVDIVDIRQILDSSGAIDGTRVSKLVSPDGSIDPVLSADNSGDVTLAGTGNLIVPVDIIHSGDTDTKITFTTDDIEFTAGNLSMLKLTEAGQDLITLGPGSGDVDIDFNGDMFLRGSDGQLGIGTASPGALLHLESTTGAGAIEYFKFVSSNEGGGFSVDDQSGVGAFLPGFSFLSSNVSGFGGLFIGKIPVAQDAAVAARAAIVVDGRRDTGAALTGAHLFAVRNFGTNHIVVDKDGQLGVGTNAPNQKLEVKGVGRFVRSNASNYAEIGAEGGVLTLQSTNPTSATFQQMLFIQENNATTREAMRVDTNGNVGIGDTAPNVALTVTTDGTVLPTISIQDESVTLPDYSGFSINPSFESDEVARLTSVSSTYGGMQFIGLTDDATANAIATIVNGYVGNSNPTDTTPAIVIRAAKHNGATSLTTMANAETVCQIRNWTSSLITVLGNGDMGINGVTVPSTELDIGAGAMEFEEMTAPAAGAANTARDYADDDGSANTRRRIVFSSGNRVTIAQDGGLQTYTPTNVVTDRSYDANATSVAELADVLGTLIADFQAAGVLG